MKKWTLHIPLFLLCFYGTAQERKVQDAYTEAYTELHSMLEGNIPLSFKRAVFVVENAYMENALDYALFDKAIQYYVQLARNIEEAGGLLYAERDKDKVLKAASIFRALKDTLTIGEPGDPKSYIKYPMTYDLHDFWGEKQWTQMFVSKLLSTGTGNCHSLPLLYKIIADELDVEAWLSIAPNHTYIKHRNKKLGWYNTELTTGTFPFDPDIKWKSYIKTEAVAKGIYMDTLSAKQNIAYAVTDMVQGYVKKFGDADVQAPIEWLETALKYYPYYINALILKAELEKKQFEQDMARLGMADFREAVSDPAMKTAFEALERSYMAIHGTGYRKMPKEMYLNWLFKVKNDTTRETYIFDTPQPFEEYGYEVTYATAGDGRYYEFYDTDSIARIGTVVINRLTGRIVKFVAYDPSEEMPDDIISRMYDPQLGRFWQVDPMGDAREWVSPYNFVQNNPINRIDPTGALDDYTLDKQGNITLVRETDDETDKLIALDDKGNETDTSIEVEKGVLDNKKEGKSSRGVAYDYYKTSSDEEGTKLFEFVANNSNVEWSQVKFGTESNYVSTAHKPHSEPGGSHLLRELVIGKYTIREHTHSHPTSTEGPSGYKPHHKKSGDRKFAEWVNKYAPRVKLKVFEKKTGKYIRYNHEKVLEE